jgi:hypothetical protein
MRWLVLAAVLLAATVSEAQEIASGRELYLGACAACHNEDGTGLSPRVLGFDAEVPDFTDCSFQTPEADPDWFAIVHEGGPVRAFDRHMPSFGDALSEAEILRILDHVRGFCADRRWPRGELNLPRALVTEKAFPENESVVTTIAGDGAVANQFLYERRIGARTQFEVMVPFVSHETGTQWRTGLGDVGGAIKHVLAHSLARGSILSAAAEVAFPTGKESDGLGSGTAVFEPFLLFGQMLPSDSFVQLQAGAEFPRRGEKEAFWRGALGRTFVSGRFGRSWSPMIELLGARDMETGAPVEWDALPQMQVSLSKRQHILVNAGVRVPLTQRSARGAQVMTYFLWDWFDGGLTDGWR